MTNMVALPEYRENPNRCVYVNGTINQELVDRLTPQIINLRHESSDPITVYIDSLGGFIESARTIMDLLHTPTQSGTKCKVITVVTGTAASAAADLLVWGDTSIAYPNARIWFHGTRQSAGERVTAEDALLIAESLKRRNEGFALDLANAALARFFFRYINLRPEFKSLRDKYPTMGDVECLAFSIVVKLTTEFAIPMQAMQKHDRLSKLTTYLSREESRDKHPPKDEKQRQAKLLKRLIDFKLREKRSKSGAEKGWLFSDKGLDEVERDFTLILDYHSGEHMKNLREQVISWGPLCLEDVEFAEYQRLPPEQTEEWLIKKTQPQVKSLWQLLVSICRLLQQGEHVLRARDAYWLGFIDEVVGARLPSFRVMLEDQAKKNLEVEAEAKQLPPMTDAATAS